MERVEEASCLQRFLYKGLAGPRGSSDKASEPMSLCQDLRCADETARRATTHANTPRAPPWARPPIRHIVAHYTGEVGKKGRRREKKGESPMKTGAGLTLGFN
ncbi:unnamed protein product [Pleuronectes platessa]|uniref:Uncharacterized protein n=1 Tax=Pleuronectes platessa TaxID=8262 RepID=A0A9N7ZEF6_PLEPL|nr:unnamed protein product [Pleuronectes platessa]